MPLPTEESRALAALFAERSLLSQREFGEKYGIGSPAMVWQYLKGNRPLNLKAACRFARGLGVHLSHFSPRLATELAELTQTGLPHATLTQTDYEEIRCVSLRLQRGVACYDIEPAHPAAVFIAFRRDWLATKGYVADKLLAVLSEDEGMRGSVGKGDLVVINTADKRLVDGHVFAINYEGEMHIRRMFRDTGSWWLYSDNPDTTRHPRKQFSDKQCFTIGRVVHRQSESI